MLLQKAGSCKRLFEAHKHAWRFPLSVNGRFERSGQIGQVASMDLNAKNVF